MVTHACRTWLRRIGSSKPTWLQSNNKTRREEGEGGGGGKDEVEEDGDNHNDDEDDNQTWGIRKACCTFLIRVIYSALFIVCLNASCTAYYKGSISDHFGGVLTKKHCSLDFTCILFTSAFFLSLILASHSPLHVSVLQCLFSTYMPLTIGLGDYSAGWKFPRKSIISVFIDVSIFLPWKGRAGG